MKHLTLIFAAIAVLSLSACDVNVPDDKDETVVVPDQRDETTVVPVPVPGPAGEKGEPGDPGKPGEPGQPGGDTTVIVPPPEAPPTP